MATGTHLVATFKQSRSMPGRKKVKEKGTQELFSEIVRGRRQGKRLSTQLGIAPCHHASYNYHTYTKDLARKDKRHSCARSQPVAT